MDGWRDNWLGWIGLGHLVAIGFLREGERMVGWMYVCMYVCMWFVLMA